MFTANSPPSFTNFADSPSRATLRKQLRHERHALSWQQQQQAADNLAANLLSHPDLLGARHVAIYLPNDGEIDPSIYADLARQRGIRLYLPVLHPIHKQRLAFSPFDEHTPLTPNRFGIPEPSFNLRHNRPSWALDAVLLPLVGFDELGGRLGMGGGFYDRTFAYTRLRPRLAPKMIGLAHECQKVDKLPVASWDIPLQGIVTDGRQYKTQIANDISNDV